MKKVKRIRQNRTIGRWIFSYKWDMMMYKSMKKMKLNLRKYLTNILYLKSLNFNYLNRILMRRRKKVDKRKKRKLKNSDFFFSFLKIFLFFIFMIKLKMHIFFFFSNSTVFLWYFKSIFPIVTYIFIKARVAI